MQVALLNVALLPLAKDNTEGILLVNTSLVNETQVLDSLIVKGIKDALMVDSESFGEIKPHNLFPLLQPFFYDLPCANETILQCRHNILKKCRQFTDHENRLVKSLCKVFVTESLKGNSETYKEGIKQTATAEFGEPEQPAARSGAKSETAETAAKGGFKLTIKSIMGTGATYLPNIIQCGLERSGYEREGKLVGAGGSFITGAAVGSAGGLLGAATGGIGSLGWWALSEVLSSDSVFGGWGSGVSWG